MIKTNHGEVAMSGALAEITNEMLNTLITYKKLLLDKEPRIAENLYNNIVVAGKFGDRRSAEAYLEKEADKLAEEIEEAFNEADQH